IYTVEISVKGSIQGDEQAAGLVLSGNVVSEMQKPAAPVPTSPANNAGLESSETDLEWQEVEGAVSYTLQIFYDANLTDLFLQENGIRANVYPLEGLLQNKDFYWRLFAINPAGKSEASVVRHFSTGENAVPLVWEKISPPELDFFVRDIIVNQNGHIFVSLTPPPSLPQEDYAAKKGTYRSVDQGQTWEKLGVEYFKYAMDSKGILYGIGGGRLDRLGRNGEDKEQLYRNRDVECMDIFLDNEDGIWLAYNNGLIMYSTDTGNEWQEFSKLSLQSNTDLKSIAWIGDKLYIATWEEGVYCSSDSGETWTRITTNSSVRYVYTIKGGNDGKLWLGTVGGLYYADKNDLNWQRVDHEILRTAKITSILVKECGVMYAGNYGCNEMGIGVFVSVDHGAGWTSVSEGMNHMSAHIVYESPQGDLYTGIGSGNPNEGGAIYHGSHEKVLETVSRELGLSEPVAVSLSSPDDAALQNGENLLLQWQASGDVCSYQVQVSLNPGFVDIVVDRGTEETQTIVKGLSDYTQYFWRVRAVNAFGPGPWSVIRSFATDPSVLVSKSDRDIPESFVLYANYPNPFNPVTTVSFDIAERSFVRVKVYNLNGRMIATLFSRSVKPGSYEATWDARGVSSGMYIITLKAGAFKAVRKCLLLK
ncbi:T9SS type A sorting domain-containing protein, partial [candidate division KSB1 bacterium]|nr:T9SS type A sorting domain-containing protein [candidate division KSB1 bacterium]